MPSTSHHSWRINSRRRRYVIKVMEPGDKSNEILISVKRGTFLLSVVTRRHLTPTVYSSLLRCLTSDWGNKDMFRRTRDKLRLVETSFNHDVRKIPRVPSRYFLTACYNMHVWTYKRERGTYPTQLQKIQRSYIMTKIYLKFCISGHNVVFRHLFNV